MTTQQRHSWGDPVRSEHKSERTCIHCGMIKASHHESGEHWIEFWQQRPGLPPMRIATDKTPACTGTAHE